MKRQITGKREPNGKIRKDLKVVTTDSSLHVEAVPERLVLRYNGRAIDTLTDAPQAVLLLAVLEEASGVVQHIAALTPESGIDESSALAELIYGLEPARLVALAVGPNAYENLNEELCAAIELLGSVLVSRLAQRDCFSLIGRKGLPPGAALESASPTGAWETTPIPVGQERLVRLRVRADRRDAGFFSGPFKVGSEVQPNDGKWHFCRFNRLGELVDVASFGFQEIQDGTAIAWLRETQPGQPIAGCTSPAFGPLPDDLRAELALCGSTAIDQLKIGDNWAFLGYRLAPPSAVSECVGRGDRASEAVLFHLGLPRAGDGYSVSLALNHRASGSLQVTVAGTEVEFLQEQFAVHGPLDGVFYLAAVDDWAGRVKDARMVGLSRGALSTTMKQWFDSVPVGHLVIAHFPPHMLRTMSSQDVALLGSIGSVMASRCGKRDSLSIIGRRGARAGTALEAIGHGAEPLSIVHRQHGIFREPAHGPVQVCLPLDRKACVASLPHGDIRIAAPSDPAYLRAAVLDLDSRTIVTTRDLSPRSDDLEGEAFMKWLQEHRQPGLGLVAFVADGPFHPREVLREAFERLGFSGLENRRCWLAMRHGDARPQCVGTDQRHDLVVVSIEAEETGAAASFEINVQMSSGRLEALSIDGLQAGHNAEAPGTVWALDGSGRVKLSVGLWPDSPAGFDAALHELRKQIDPNGYILIVGSARALSTAVSRAPDLMSSWGSALPLAEQSSLPACWVLLGRPHLGRASGFEMVTGAAASTRLHLPRRTNSKRFLPAVALVIGVLFVLGALVTWWRHQYNTAGPHRRSPNNPIQRGARRLNASTFLVAHNAFASTAYGWNDIDAAQALTYAELFESVGVRGFMLDVWPGPALSSPTPPGPAPTPPPAPTPAPVSSPASPPDLVLRHGTLHGWLGNPDLSFQSAVEEFIRLLLKHPTELIFVFIESPPGWLPDQRSNQVFLNSIPPHGRDLVAWIDNSYPANSTGPTISIPVASQQTQAAQVHTWPPYDDFVRANRRLIFFVDRDRGTPSSLRHRFPFMWRFIRESGYGDAYPGWFTGVAERDQSRWRGSTADPRQAVLLNHFPALPFMQDYEGSDRAINSVLMLTYRTLAALNCFGTVPNFVAVDHVHRGAAASFVRQLNALWQTSERDKATGTPWTLNAWAAAIKSIR